ncbi:MAG: hypothetical protein QOK37_2129 [Thermoanaerobaculia bacterium]|jgi:DNA-binding response OmpR family regulator|nr:hypothetical protein [Thermoanaerobaculia bacterium]
MDAKAYQFGTYRLDPADCTLRNGEELIALTPKAFDLLVLLKGVVMKRLQSSVIPSRRNRGVGRVAGAV